MMRVAIGIEVAYGPAGQAYHKCGLIDPRTVVELFHALRNPLDVLTHESPIRFFIS